MSARSPEIMKEVDESPEPPKPATHLERSEPLTPGEDANPGECTSGEEDAGVHGADAPPHASGRIDDIELLRAVAIILVLIEHMRVSLYPWLGVLETRFNGLFG